MVCMGLSKADRLIGTSVPLCITGKLACMPHWVVCCCAVCAQDACRDAAAAHLADLMLVCCMHKLGMLRGLPHRARQGTCSKICKRLRLTESQAMGATRTSPYTCK